MATFDLAAEYLDLLKRCLTREVFPDERWDPTLSNRLPFDRALREVGRDWPTEALTMVGLKRLNNLQDCVVSAIQDRVPGDLMETGVWRGGCAILMRAVLAVYGEPQRSVWLADSFRGLPVPDAAAYPADLLDRHSTLAPYLGVALDTVRDNLRRFGFLDSQVRFLEGWFRDTLPTAPVEKIAVLRLDGDMYESTYVAISSLYPKVSVGGFVIVDDYGALPNCRLAIEDYRAQQGITEQIHEVDWTGVYWRKER